MFLVGVFTVLCVIANLVKVCTVLVNYNYKMITHIYSSSVIVIDADINCVILGIVQSTFARRARTIITIVKIDMNNIKIRIYTRNSDWDHCLCP